jgi:hypothetical protein
VSDDSIAAVVTVLGERLDSAFEAVEGMFLDTYRHSEGFVAVVAADFAA